MKHVLEIDGVRLEFGLIKILRDVYLKSETGKVTGLLGRNGSGKSCLMRIIFGELEVKDASVRIDKKSLERKYRNPSDIKYLPQSPFIPKSLTLQRIFSDFELDYFDFTREFPEFEKHLNTRFRNLSGGEQRIAEIYTILTSKVKFCLLDEPFSQVMPGHAEKIKQLIQREKNNKGIVLTDHLYRHIVDISDNLYVLTEGKTHLASSPKDIDKLGYARFDGV